LLHAITVYPKRCRDCQRTPPTLFFSSTFLSPTELYSLSLHDALPIYLTRCKKWAGNNELNTETGYPSPMAHSLRVDTHETICSRSEEHTSELQSRFDLVCRLLLEKKK